MCITSITANTAIKNTNAVTYEFTGSLSYITAITAHIITVTTACITAFFFLIQSFTSTLSAYAQERHISVNAII